MTYTYRTPYTTLSLNCSTEPAQGNWKPLMYTTYPDYSHSPSALSHRRQPDQRVQLTETATGKELSFQRCDS